MNNNDKPLVAAKGHDGLPAVAEHAPGATVHLPVALGHAEAPGAGPLAPAGAPTFAALAGAFRRRWPLAVGCALAGAAALVALVFALMPLKYRASLRLLMSGRGDAVLLEGPHEHLDLNVLKANQAALVKSPAVWRLALEQKTPTGAAVRDLSIVRAQADPVEWGETALKVDFPSPEVLRASLPGDRADEVAILLNALGDALLRVNEERDEEAKRKIIEDLKLKKKDRERELSQARALFDSRAKVHDEKLRDQALRLAQEAETHVRKRLLDNSADLTRARIGLVSLKQELEEVDSAIAPAERLDEFLKIDPRASGIQLGLAKVQENIRETIRVGRKEFLMAELAKLEEERAALLKDLARIRDELRPELELRFREAERSRLKTAIRTREQNINELQVLGKELELEVKRAEETTRKAAPLATPLPPDLKNLQDNIETLKKATENLGATIARLEDQPYRPRVTIQAPAAEPSSKDASRQVKIAGAGGVGFFFLILFGVTYLELRSNKVGGSEDLQGAGISLVGTIPNLPKHARQPIAGNTGAEDAHWQSVLSESVDSIRTLLLHVSRTDSLRVLMVTSAVGGEGKTSLASQLAASLARAWRKTLLIDGDLRHPAGHSLFGLPLEPGFSEVLRGEVKPADAIKPTALSRLWMMPAGHWDNHAVQALAQDNVSALLDQLKQQYDFIIVDSCPVLPVADSLVLGQHVDGVLFSVLRDVSRLPALHAAHQKMVSLGIRTLGAVVIGAGQAGDAAGYRYAAAVARS